MDGINILDLIQAKVNEVGSQSAFAELVGTSGANVSITLAGKRRPGRKILKGVGVKEVITYEPCDESADHDHSKVLISDLQPILYVLETTTTDALECIMTCIEAREERAGRRGDEFWWAIVRGDKELSKEPEYGYYRFHSLPRFGTNWSTCVDKMRRWESAQEALDFWHNNRAKIVATDEEYLMFALEVRGKSGVMR